jgi:hypothetical protein
MGCFRSPLQQPRYPTPPRFAEGGDACFNVVVVWVNLLFAFIEDN